jgi:cellulose synthase operon protein C
VADTSRIDELRRRVQRDPASIAFAQLAEEYRRAGRYKEAIETCEQGLAHHPGYLSARVTLGRSYLETDELESAQLELKQVLRAAPENLAALRGLAEIHHRRGELHEALAHYRTALEFAHNDPELQHLVEQIAKELEPQPAAPAVVDGLSFEDVKNTFLNLSMPETATVDEAQAVHADAPVADGGVPVADAGVAVADAGVPVADAVADAGALAPGADAPPDIDEALPWLADDGSALEVYHDAAPATHEDAGLHTPVEQDASPVEAAPPVAEPEPAAVDAGPIVEVLSDTGGVPEPVIEERPAQEEAPPEEPFGAAEEHILVAESAIAAHETTPAPPGDGGPQVDALERWLETIIADRQRRA